MTYLVSRCHGEIQLIKVPECSVSPRRVSTTESAVRPRIRINDSDPGPHVLRLVAHSPPDCRCQEINPVTVNKIKFNKNVKTLVEKLTMHRSAPVVLASKFFFGVLKNESDISVFFRLRMLKNDSDIFFCLRT